MNMTAFSCQSPTIIIWRNRKLPKEKKYNKQPNKYLCEDEKNHKFLSWTHYVAQEDWWLAFDLRFN